jgi:histone chaperone ASF1
MGTRFGMEADLRWEFFKVSTRLLTRLISVPVFNCFGIGSERSSSKLDQELDSLLVGPIPVGVNKFKFVADAPNPSLIPSSDVLGVTVILLTCSYDEREFVRVGYYVSNELPGFEGEEEVNGEEAKEGEEPKLRELPKDWKIEDVTRNILAEKPRVTRFNITWLTRSLRLYC